MEVAPLLEGEQQYGNLQFLIGHFLYCLNLKIANPARESLSLDDEVLYLDALASGITEKDPVFRKEWQEIQEERSKTRGGSEDARIAERLHFRYRELRCNIRSLQREGILSRLDVPRSSFRPSKGVNSVEVTP